MIARSALLVGALALGCGSGDAGGGGSPPESTATATAEGSGPAGALARCLTERGVVYYGSALCHACRVQQRAFGPAFAAVAQVECHPHAPSADPERCVARGIRVTPTWLLEPDGQERERLEGAHGLAALAAFAGCPTDGL